MTDIWVPPGQPPRRRSRWISSPMIGLYVAAGIAAVAFLVLSHVVYRSFSVPSRSMSPTFPAGSYVLVDKLDRAPEDGDVIVFRSWQDSVGHKGDSLKRVLARGGETVQCCRAGAILRNGTTLDEPYLGAHSDTSGPSTYGPITVPPNRLWVLGDTRDNSADSRFHLDNGFQGTIATSDVIGVVTAHGGRLAGYGMLLVRAGLLGLALGGLVSLVLALARRRSRA